MINRKRRKKIRQACWTAALLVSIGVFCFCGYQLFSIYAEYHEGMEEYDSIQELAVKKPAQIVTQEPEPSEAVEPTVTAEPAETTAPLEGETIEPTPDKNKLQEGGEVVVTDPVSYLPPEIDFSVLKGINQDIIGWIDMGVLGISYPIVKGVDNNQYLRTTFENKKNSAGSIFIDYHNSGDFSDCNTIVYGHNMRNGSMFGKLKNIRKKSMYAKCRYFWICTPEGNYQYEVFAAYETKVDSDTYTLFSQPDESFKDYLQTMRERSELNTGKIPLVEGDKIVTLSTCTSDSAYRFVVQAKRING